MGTVRSTIIIIAMSMKHITKTASMSIAVMMSMNMIIMRLSVTANTFTSRIIFTTKTKADA